MIRYSGSDDGKNPTESNIQNLSDASSLGEELETIKDQSIF
jgi:hypothetical protein